MLAVVVLLSPWLVAWLCLCPPFLVAMLTSVTLLSPWLFGCLPGCVSACYFCVGCLLIVVILLSPWPFGCLPGCVSASYFCLLDVVILLSSSCLPGCVGASYFCVLAVVMLLSSWLFAWLCVCLPISVCYLWSQSCLVGWLPGCVSVSNLLQLC